MWKSSEVYNINKNDPKTLSWGTPKLVLTDALFLYQLSVRAVFYHYKEL